ncbi:hypothetical protein FOA52_000940 [Chlamydomonas sp. UWO 241]|nr:hypothetical protein FOA52_000940 [Chlamydomonas sp. UWO 241]
MPNGADPMSESKRRELHAIKSTLARDAATSSDLAKWTCIQSCFRLFGHSHVTQVLISCASNKGGANGSGGSGGASPRPPGQAPPNMVQAGSSTSGTAPRPTQPPQQQPAPGAGGAATPQMMQHMMQLMQQSGIQLNTQSPDFRRQIQEFAAQQANKKPRTDGGPPAPWAPPPQRAGPGGPGVPGGGPMLQRPGPAPATAAPRPDLDDITRQDMADTDILAGVFDAEAEREALMGGLGRGPAPATFKPATQAEYVLSERPLLRRAVEAARRHGLTSVAPDVYQYLALAAEVHLAGLLRDAAKSAQQRSDPARDFPGMMRSGPNLRQALGVVARSDKAVRDKKAAEEQEQLLQQALSKSKKIGDEQKEKIQQAKDAKSKTQQMEGARNVMSSAFTFKKKGGLFGNKGGKKGGDAEKGGKADEKGDAKAAGGSEKAKGAGGGGGGGVGAKSAATDGAEKTKAPKGKVAAAAAARKAAEAEAGKASGGGGGGAGGSGQAPAPASVKTEPAGGSGSADAPKPAPAPVSTALVPAPPAHPVPAKRERERDTGPIVVSARDIAAAMERDPLLCRHPLLFRLMSEAPSVGTVESAPPPPPGGH